MSSKTNKKEETKKNILKALKETNVNMTHEEAENILESLEKYCLIIINQTLNLNNDEKSI
jgi:hypothetical protein